MARQNARQLDGYTLFGDALNLGLSGDYYGAII